MLKSIGTALPVILPITLISVGLVAWQSGEMAKAYGLSKAGLISVYLVGGLILGCAAVWIFKWMAGRWSQDAATYFFWLAIGLAMLLNLMAWSERQNQSGVVIVIWFVLNAVWGLGYGWLLPRILG